MLCFKKRNVPVLLMVKQVLIFNVSISTDLGSGKTYTMMGN